MSAIAIKSRLWNINYSPSDFHVIEKKHIWSLNVGYKIKREVDSLPISGYSGHRIARLQCIFHQDVIACKQKTVANCIMIWLLPTMLCVIPSEINTVISFTVAYNRSETGGRQKRHSNTLTLHSKSCYITCILNEKHCPSNICMKERSTSVVFNPTVMSMQRETSREKSLGLLRGFCFFNVPVRSDRQTELEEDPF